MPTFRKSTLFSVKFRARATQKLTESSSSFTWIFHRKLHSLSPFHHHLSAINTRLQCIFYSFHHLVKKVHFCCKTLFQKIIKSFLSSLRFSSRNYAKTQNTSIRMGNFLRGKKDNLYSI